MKHVKKFNEGYESQTPDIEYKVFIFDYKEPVEDILDDLKKQLNTFGFSTWQKCTSNSDTIRLILSNEEITVEQADNLLIEWSSED